MPRNCSDAKRRGWWPMRREPLRSALTFERRLRPSAARSCDGVDSDIHTIWCGWKSPASHSRLSVRFSKPESHTVGLADRIVLCVVKVRVSRLPSWRAATRRGQRPNAERMVSGVLWVRVDLGLCLENEPRFARLIDDVGFRDITGSGARVRTLGRT